MYSQYKISRASSSPCGKLENDDIVQSVDNNRRVAQLESPPPEVRLSGSKVEAGQTEAEILEPLATEAKLDSASKANSLSPVPSKRSNTRSNSSEDRSVPAKSFIEGCSCPLCLEEKRQRELRLQHHDDCECKKCMEKRKKPAHHETCQCAACKEKKDLKEKSSERMKCLSFGRPKPPPLPPKDFSNTDLTSTGPMPRSECIRAEPRSDLGPDFELERRSESRSEPRSELKLDFASDGKSESISEPRSELRPEFEPERRSESASELTSELRSDCYKLQQRSASRSQPRSKLRPACELERNCDGKFESKTELKPDFKLELMCSQNEISTSDDELEQLIEKKIDEIIRPLLKSMMSIEKNRLSAPSKPRRKLCSTFLSKNSSSSMLVPSFCEYNEKPKRKMGSTPLPMGSPDSCSCSYEKPLKYHSGPSCTSFCSKRTNKKYDCPATSINFDDVMSCKSCTSDDDDY